MAAVVASASRQSNSTSSSIHVRRLVATELPAWAAFCERCFSSKRPSPPSASFFLRKVRNDPTFDCSLVFVAVDVDVGKTSADAAAAAVSDDDVVFVGTLRIFDRTICVDGRAVSRTAGIGEVCTDPTYRGQGIASRLLDSCLVHCREQQITVSSLHASPAFTPFYQSRGWTVCRPVAYAQITTAIHTGAPAPSFDDLHADLRYQVLDLPASEWGNDSSKWLALQPLYASWSSGIPGTALRSASYWATWVTGEWQARNAVVRIALCPESQRPVAYAVLARYKGQLRVLECALESDMNLEEARKIWDALLHHALLHADLGCNDANPVVVCPLVVVRRLALDSRPTTFCTRSEERNELRDTGWLYHFVSGDIDSRDNAVETCVVAADGSAVTNEQFPAQARVDARELGECSVASYFAGDSRTHSSSTTEELHTVWVVDGF